MQFNHIQSVALSRSWPLFNNFIESEILVFTVTHKIFLRTDVCFDVRSSTVSDKYVYYEHTFQGRQGVLNLMKNIKKKFSSVKKAHAYLYGVK